MRDNLDISGLDCMKHYPLPQFAAAEKIGFIILCFSVMQHNCYIFNYPSRLKWHITAGYFLAEWQDLLFLEELLSDNRILQRSLDYGYFYMAEWQCYITLFSEWRSNGYANSWKLFIIYSYMCISAMFLNVFELLKWVLINVLELLKWVYMNALLP